MLSRQLDLNPEIQAVLDLCEIQGVPVRFENSVFMINKFQIGTLTTRMARGVVATQNIDTVMRWVEEYKRWNPKP
jgi:hypothetical protein